MYIVKCDWKSRGVSNHGGFTRSIITNLNYDDLLKVEYIIHLYWPKVYYTNSTVTLRYPRTSPLVKQGHMLSWMHTRNAGVHSKKLFKIICFKKLVVQWWQKFVEHLVKFVLKTRPVTRIFSAGGGPNPLGMQCGRAPYYLPAQTHLI